VFAPVLAAGVHLPALACMALDFALCAQPITIAQGLHLVCSVFLFLLISMATHLAAIEFKMESGMMSSARSMQPQLIDPSALLLDWSKPTSVASAAILSVTLLAPACTLLCWGLSRAFRDVAADKAALVLRRRAAGLLEREGNGACEALRLEVSAAALGLCDGGGSWLDQFAAGALLEEAGASSLSFAMVRCASAVLMTIVSASALASRSWAGLFVYTHLVIAAYLTAAACSTLQVHRLEAMAEARLAREERRADEVLSSRSTWRETERGGSIVPLLPCDQSV
jgi:hypothetical protein